MSRASRPQWRKELSERVREIQERRARDAETEIEDASQIIIKQPSAEVASPQLGLVPPQDAPAVNPIVAAALKRLERARQSPTMPRPRASMGGAAAAAIARVAEDQYQTETKPSLVQASAPTPVLTPAPSLQPPPEKIIEAKAAEQVREHSLIIVPAQPTTKVPPPVSKPQRKQLISEEVEDTRPEVLDEDLGETEFDEALYDDRAPVLSRLAGSAVDLLVVAFASSPFAAVIELTNGNWGDWRVMASMSGIVLIVMFLYLTAATALAGRTWGMSLVSLRAVDADTGLPPTTRQSVGRAILYILSLITLGLGILYALFDAEGRTAHDHLSGTAVVRD
ncbi:MAG TPA: RDD family protein [Pyrinomonadaceae bacterium]|nr:RDD family protein [Pyrinomonadaceae bacterium]